MLTLYHAPQSRSSRFIWLLEELGVDYEIEYVEIRRRDGAGHRDPKNPHPDGKVPALVHDGVLITESAAIALYLTDAFPKAGIGAAVGDPLRGPYLTWLAYYAGVLEPVIAGKFNLLIAETPDQDAAYRALDERLSTHLEANDYMVGGRFSAADILFVSLLQFFRTALPDHACYDRFLDRLDSRPARKRALAKDAAR
ncbi:glutathione S-transferase family protein [soil metagenome]